MKTELWPILCSCSQITLSLVLSSQSERHVQPIRLMMGGMAQMSCVLFHSFLIKFLANESSSIICDNSFW